MLVGLVVGVVFGLGLQLVYGSDNPVLKESISWFNIVGNGYAAAANDRHAAGVRLDPERGGQAAQRLFWAKSAS